MEIYINIQSLRNSVGLLTVVFMLTLTGCAFNPPQKTIEPDPVVLKCPDISAPLSPAVVVISKPQECPKLKIPKKIKEVPVATPVIVQPSELLTVGRIENVAVEQLKMTLPAKIDSGALLTSLNALELKKFERDGKKWVRFAILNPTSNQKQFFELPMKRIKTIKQLDGIAQKRPVVALNLKIGSVTGQVDVTLSDRSGYNYQLLIGRNFMWDRILIDVGKKFIADKPQ